jgi:hypothetical protein
MLWVVGENDYGWLGTGTNKSEKSPKEICKVKDVFEGYGTSFIVDENYKLLSCGNNY